MMLRPPLRIYRYGLVLLCLSWHLLPAQSLERKVFSPGGSTFNLNTQFYGYTIGEPIIGTDQLTIPYLTKGFQQPEPMVLLPVRLTLHAAVPEADGVILHWSTSDDPGDARFRVERAMPAGGFAEAATLPSTGQGSYRWTDESLPTRATALQYRIVQVLPDGSQIHSQVREVQLPRRSPAWRITPNPAQDHCSLQGHLAEPGSVGLQVWDLQGRLVYEWQGTLPAGEARLALPVAAWASGLYQLRLRQPAGAWQGQLRRH